MPYGKYRACSDQEILVCIKNGDLVLHKSVDEIREIEGKSVDELFREVFRC